MKKIVVSLIMALLAIFASIMLNVIGHSDMQEYLMFFSAFAMIIAMLSALSFLEAYQYDINIKDIS